MTFDVGSNSPFVSQANTRKENLAIYQKSLGAFSQIPLQMYTVNATMYFGICHRKINIDQDCRSWSLLHMIP